MRAHLIRFAALLLALAGCAGTPGQSGNDGGFNNDSGSPGSDSGTRGTDSGTPGTDAGTRTDGGTGSQGDGGRESWVWPYNSNISWPTQLTAIATNPTAFTHLSPTFYTLNYVTPYTTGVAYYVDCAGGATACTANGGNDFGTWMGATLTTQAFTLWAHALGLKVVPAIYAGSSNAGKDTSVQAILCMGSTSGCTAQTNFITAMVGELSANGYDGYNLDWEMGSSVGKTYAPAFVSFVNAFKAALVSAGHPDALVTVDAIVSNINGTNCSSNNGYLDFPQLQASSIDRVIIEDYSSTYQTSGWTAPTACASPLKNFYGSAVLNASSPASCDFTFTGMMIMMCPPNLGTSGALDMDKAVIGLEASIHGTNPIAGQAMAALGTYGFTKIAFWPQYDNSTNAFMSADGISPSGASWYTLSQQFLGQ